VDNILRITDIVACTGLSRVSIWRMVRAGPFPAPIQLSANTIGWLESEIAKWQETRPRRTYGAQAPKAA
jgi:prophage regulatory protein